MQRLRLRRTALAALLIGAHVASGSGAAAQTFVFDGRGWGHGLGMSQYGAKGMADAGRAADDILRHFYTGTSVQRMTLPAEIRVGLAQAQQQVPVSGDGAVDVSGAGGTARASSGETWNVSVDPTGVLVVRNPAGVEAYRSGTPVTLSYEPHGTAVRIASGGNRYKRGRIDLDAYQDESGWRIRAVLMVGFEQYLYGLGEVPSSWHAEALRAQAVAGRTYALEKVARLGQNRPTCNCGVYATTIDQAYVGWEKEAGASGARWADAVDASAGMAVTSGGRPIEALYSSSDGGHTEHNENVWGGEPRSYLRGVCDPWDRAGGDNPNRSWSTSLDEPTLRSKLSGAGVNVGTIQRVEFVPPRGVSGRVIPVSGDRGGVRIVGSSSTARMSGDRFRSVVGLKSTLYFRRGAGYSMVASDGGMFTFGDATFYGSMAGKPLEAPVVGMAASPLGGQGYWLVGADGAVYPFGNVCAYGSMAGKPLVKPVVGMTASPTGAGYWMVASDGGIFAFGDARFHGSMGGKPLDTPIAGMTSTPSGAGYWMVASDGGIFSFGDARFHGSMGGKPLDTPIVGMTATASGAGYWMVASDGGIFAFGDARFHGSMGGKPLDKPVVGMTTTPAGGGYWMVANDGGIFSFGDAQFHGSMGGKLLDRPINGMAVS